MGGKGGGKKGAPPIPKGGFAPKPKEVAGGDFPEGSSVEVASGAHEGKCGVAFKVVPDADGTRWKVAIEGGPCSWINDVRKPPDDYVPSDAVKAAVEKANNPPPPKTHAEIWTKPKGQGPKQPDEGDTVEVLQTPHDGRQAIVVKRSGEGKEARYRVKFVDDDKMTWVDKVRLIKEGTGPPAASAPAPAAAGGAAAAAPTAKVIQRSATREHAALYGYDGTWLSKQVGGTYTIAGNCLKDAAGGDPVELTFIGTNKVEMMLGPTKCSGQLENGAITWTFGDTWTRQSDAPPSASDKELQSKYDKEKTRADRLQSDVNRFKAQVDKWKERAELAEKKLGLFGNQVTWTLFDDEVPKGTVGEVVGYTEDLVGVQFANGKCRALDVLELELK